MTNKRFTDDETKIIAQTPYVLRVSSVKSVYTLEFKKFAIEQAKNGLSSVKIFKLAGFDPEMLGKPRMYAALKTFKKEASSPEGIRQPKGCSTEEQMTAFAKEDFSRKVELCTLAGVSRSGYYNWIHSEASRQKREKQDQEDFALILQAYNYRGYAKGVKGIYMRLLHTGIRMNVKKIRQLMKKYKLTTLDTEVLIHSDQECHYTSIKFRELITNHGLRQSMSRRGNCWDSFEAVKSSIDDWMDYYNNDRYQWNPIITKRLTLGIKVYLKMSLTWGTLYHENREARRSGD